MKGFPRLLGGQLLGPLLYYLIGCIESKTVMMRCVTELGVIDPDNLVTAETLAGYNV